MFFWDENWEVSLEKGWLKFAIGDPLTWHGRAYRGTLKFVVTLLLGPRRNVCGHVVADPFCLFATLCRGCSVREVCPVFLNSPMLAEREKDSLVRGLVICHSAINAHVSRTRLRGHDHWFLTATCKGYEGTWVPSTLRACRFVFPRRYQNRWSNPDVWEPKEFDQNRWMRLLRWSGTLLCLVCEES